MLKRWTGELIDDRSKYLDRFGLLLAVTAASVAALSLFDLSGPAGDLDAELGELAATVLVGATFLLALYASGFARRWQRSTNVLVGAIVVIDVVLLVVSQVTGTPTSLVGPLVASRPLVLVILSALAPVVVVRRLVRHRQVTGSTLLAAISAYLLLPLAFYYAFLAVDAHQAALFFEQPEPTTSFMYFSLTTLTTLGYGDLAAVTPLGRMLATAEAVVGQVYLVTLVAMLVGLYARRRRTDDRDEAA